ncbi:MULTISPECIES: DUF2993 domain-containing protein [Actinomadura]|uniref:DUF2993 domain-containing protein n=1 Tax=Actinomadura litoris TaxID=2678616 RepID=A0A7K1KS79_9ACTN|nr:MULTISPECIES: DUF2993 domain-containing protein [Actinomadura]MBT2208151.1 LmeA family phospholipid-binding protein [Actinomadura sp. NEAU-AAG7]MUN35019.1 DUF2993 domain-containing protein [Actinomadura litoris]
MRKVLLVLLILLVVGVAAADRIGVRVAQDEIGKQVAAEYNLPERPDVTIHGIPFLTQAIGGDYGHIDVKIGVWTSEGVTVNDVKVDMRDVKAPLPDVLSGGTANVVAGKATASAVVPYEAVQKQAPRQVKSIKPKGDDLELEMTGTMSGIPVAGTAVVSAKPTAKGIAVTPVSFTSRAGAQVPMALVRGPLTWVVPIPELPVGSRISKLEPTEAGLRVEATATDVRLNDPERSQRLK